MVAGGLCVWVYMCLGLPSDLCLYRFQSRNNIECVVCVQQWDWGLDRLQTRNDDLFWHGPTPDYNVSIQSCSTGLHLPSHSFLSEAICCCVLFPGCSQENVLHLCQVLYSWLCLGLIIRLCLLSDSSMELVPVICFEGFSCRLSSH